MGAEIIDGVGLSDHVTSDQVGASHAGSIGPGALILDYGESLAYSIVSNNQINIADGVFMIQGKRGWIIPGTVEQINIATGQNGQYRNDLICIKYSRDPESSVESFDFEVVQGTPGASGTDPTVTTGDINDGALESYSPIYRVRLNGINIAGVDLMATKVTTLIDLAGNIGSLQALETDNKTNIVAAMNELKDGINELNGNLQWKAITSVEGVLGGKDIDISSAVSGGAKEIHVVVQWLDGSTTRRQNFNINVSTDLSDSYAYFVKGGYYGNTYYQYCELAASRTRVRLNTLMYNGQSIVSSAKTWVAYR